MPKVLVTGGAGFIGSHLCEELIKRDYEVIALDNLSKGTINNFAKLKDCSGFRFVEADLKDLDKVMEICKDVQIVFHMADESDIQYALKHPESYFQQNSTSLMNILLACRDNAVHKLFFPSSTTVFGSHAIPPIAEDFGPLLPESLYGASKVSSEAFLKAWSIAYDIDITIFRFAAIIGPRQDHGVVHDFVKRLSHGEPILRVFGSGEQKRAFILVDDCVEIIVSFMKQEKIKNFTILHLGNKDVVEIRQVAEIVCKEFYFPLDKIEFEKQILGWVGDSKTNELNCNALSEYGFSPRHSSYEAVCEAAKRLKIQYYSVKS